MTVQLGTRRTRTDGERIKFMTDGLAFKKMAVEETKTS